MIARQNMQWDAQPTGRTPHQAELLLRPVVRVVAGQHGKVDVTCKMGVDVLDEREEVAVVLLIFACDVQVTEVNPAQHRTICFSRHGRHSRFGSERGR
jgi:hypothetical protein